ncbi:MAG TPA: hypothetical protein VNW92_21530 [Polyangiaceae bacterium]|jgi:hypothetical protein|nr:hypothetical protein [Polyangiaceae bacterium]
MADATMSEVVRRLRAEHSGALLELAEFDHALEDILREIKLLAVVSSELLQASKNFGALKIAEGRERLGALQDDAGRASKLGAQLVVAFSAVRMEVLRWNISPASSNRSGSNGSSSPVGAS